MVFDSFENLGWNICFVPASPAKLEQQGCQVEGEWFPPSPAFLFLPHCCIVTVRATCRVSYPLHPLHPLHPLAAARARRQCATLISNQRVYTDIIDEIAIVFAMSGW